MATTTGIIDSIKAPAPTKALANPDDPNAVATGAATTAGQYTATPGGDPNGDPAAQNPEPGVSVPKSAVVDGSGATSGNTPATGDPATVKPQTAIPVTTQPTPAPAGDGTPGSPTPNLPPPDQATAIPAPVAPAVPAPTAAAPAAPAAPGTQAWTPTAGIVDQLKQSDVNTIQGANYTPTAVPGVQTATATGYDANGYTAEKAPDAVGYTPQGYTASTSDENLSGAVGRIVGEDSPVLQRARALADQQANSRGIINSTMATQAGTAATLDAATQLGAGDVQNAQFNASARNQASAFLADATNTAQQFLAAAKNQNGMFNAEQANQASAFTAQATDTAKQLLAAANNTASMFNSGEANKQAQFSVLQTNQALMFAAQMDQAAREKNADAFNQAHQRYADAVNAALAAQNDAENLAKRDTAQLGEARYESDSRNSATVTAAGISASATMGAAQLASADRAAALKEQAHEYGMTLGQHETEFAATLSANQFNTYQQGLSAGLSSQLEPDAKQDWLHNYNAVWAASGSLPFDIDMTKFPAAGTTTTTTP